MLNNFQIIELAEKMNIPLESVFFKDEIDVSDLKVGKSYVINLEDEFDEDGKTRNGGSHWTCFHIGNHNGEICIMYFDSYGISPPENLKKIIKAKYNKKINYLTKNVQSLMSDACGWFCLAYLHFINAFYNRTGDLFSDSAIFLDLFEDLDLSVDWQKNEMILKMFFVEKTDKKNGLDKVFDTSKADDINKTSEKINIEPENITLRK